MALETSAVKLISLTANQPSFHTVRFRRQGLSLIVGQKHTPAERGGRGTYNGVGKSLVLYFTHFCLGAATNDRLAELLPDWEFSLAFEMEGKEVVATRSTKEQKVIKLNGVPLEVANFNKDLGEKIFGLKPGVQFLSFRTLAKRFMRSGKHAYLSFDEFDHEEKEFQQLITNGYLLGLPTDLIQRKHDLRSSETEMKDLEKRLKTDEVFRGFFTTQSDARIERKDLEDQIARLSAKLNDFKVAEDYADIKTDVAAIKRKLREASNEIVGMVDRIKSIDAALVLGADISRESLLEVFNSAKVVLRDEVRGSLQDLEQFHQRLLQDRNKRFSEEKHSLQQKVARLKSEEQKLDSALSQQLHYLDSHGELEEYLAMSKKLSGLTSQLDRVKSYQEILQRYKDEVRKIRVEQEEQNAASEKFLKENEAGLQKNMALFRELSARFYEARAGGVTVDNNDGNNMLRFKISCNLDDDSSSGINEVKIFCYDAMVLRAKWNHNVQFLFHDSLLYSNMDPRQRSILFREAKATAERDGEQYIATINQDALDSMREELSAEEFNQIFGDAVVLQLTDKSDADKLLGVHINFDYDS